MPPLGKYEVVPTFQEPDLPDHRAEPLPCKKKYLPGDWDGLLGLAGDLYGYVRRQKSSGAIPQLVGWVKELVENDPDNPGGFDGKWVGEAAHAFTGVFTTDAALMNGLNKVICSVASILEHLGCDLSSNQYYLEVALEDWGKQYDTRFTLDWLMYKDGGVYALMWNPPEVSNMFPWDSNALSGAASAVFERFLEKAYVILRRAGAELTAIANLLFEAASFYVNMSKYNSKAPENLLSPTQAQDLEQNFDAVKNNLSNFSKQLSADSGDVDAAKHQLSNLGARAGDISNLIQDVQSAKKTAGWLDAAAAFGKVAKDAIPLLAVIGLA